MKNSFLNKFLITTFNILVFINSASALESKNFQCSGRIKRIILNSEHLKADGSPQAEYIHELSEGVSTSSLTPIDRRYSQGVINFKDGYKIVFTVSYEDGTPKLAGHFRRVDLQGHITVLSVGGSQDSNLSLGTLGTLSTANQTVVFTSTEAINGYINEKTNALEAVENGKLPSGIATDAWLSCI